MNPREDSSAPIDHDAARYLALVDVAAWQDKLEVDVEFTARQCTRPSFFEELLRGMSSRCQRVAAEGLGLPCRVILRDLEKHVDDRVREALFPLALVDRFGDGKRTQAILDVARGELSREEIILLTSRGDRPDRRALLWRLFLKNPSSLEIVFHVDRLHRRGVARFVLADTPPAPDHSLQTFLTRDAIQPHLDAFEAEGHTLRTSVCTAVVWRDDGPLVFIKRESYSAFVAKGRRNLFGFEREWIVLAFSPDAERLRIASISPDVPLLLANALASAFFNVSVGFVEDTVETSTDTVRKFLTTLSRSPARLPLVALHLRNSPFRGQPSLQLSDEDNNGLGPAIEHITRAHGGAMVSPENIISLRLYTLGKRVKLLFEPVLGRKAFIVRYADQPLVEHERRLLERMLHDDFGIVAISTEKRRAR